MAVFAIFLLTTNAISMGYAPARPGARWIRPESLAGSSPVVKWLAAAAAVAVAPQRSTLGVLPASSPCGEKSVSSQTHIKTADARDTPFRPDLAVRQAVVGPPKIWLHHPRVTSLGGSGDRAGHHTDNSQGHAPREADVQKPARLSSMEIPERVRRYGHVPVDDVQIGGRATVK
jgi:hypothetical protein